MTQQRGADNIRRFNLDRSERNLFLVEQELKLCKKRKLQFQSAGLLATYLSDVTGVHRTTFSRNKKYRNLIFIYVGTQPGAASIVDDETNDPWILKAKLASTQAELGSAKQEVKKLNAVLKRVENPIAHTITGNHADVDFSNVCVVLAQVITRAETFSVNTKDGTLVDLAARPSDQIVATSQRVSSFIRWVKANESLPYVKSIPRI